MKIYTFCLPLIFIFSAITGFSQPGSLDSSFSENGKKHTAMGITFSELKYVTVQSDGKILAVGGAVMGMLTTDSFALARYMPDGTLDKTFGDKGKLIMGIGTSYSYATYAITLPNGKILVGGYSGGHYNSDFVLLRLKDNGTIDSSFGTNGKVITDINVQDFAKQIILQADGKIVVTGEANNQAPYSYNTYIFMARYFADGKIDSSFGINGKSVTDFAKWGERLLCVQAQHDGKLMLAVWVNFNSDSLYFLLARYEQNGQLDSTFGTHGYLLSQVFKYFGLASAAFQKNGKYVAVGTYMDRDYINSNFVVLRFNTDASLDKTFGNNGMTVTDFFGKNDNAQKVLIQKDGKIIVAGDANLENGNASVALVGYNSKGFPDNSFGIKGKVCNITKNFSHAYAAALQDDGKVVVGGFVDNYHYPVYSSFLICRLHGDCAPATKKNIINSSELNVNGKITAFPNPVNDVLNISGLKASVTYNFSITNINGIVVAKKFSVRNETYDTWHLSNLNKGLYHLTVASNFGKKTFRFLKQ